MKQTINSLVHIGAALLINLILAGCGVGGADADDGPSGLDYALVVTTDFQSGSYAVISTEDYEASVNLQVIHSDAICRFSGSENTPLIVSRLGADSLSLLNPQSGWSIQGEHSAGAGSNVQDVALLPGDLAVVARYSDSHLLLLNTETGEFEGEIDLTAYADEDGVPEAAWVLPVGERIFVALQRLTSLRPSDFSLLVEVDLPSMSVVGEWELTTSNPFVKMRYHTSLGQIVLGETGLFGELDGGVELFDPLTNTLSGLLITEETLGGDILDVILSDGDKGWALVAISIGAGSYKTRLVSFDISSGVVLNTIADSDAYDFASIELSPNGLEIWMADRNRTQPGVRIFSALDDEELFEKAIDTGLPPYMICFPY